MSARSSAPGGYQEPSSWMDGLRYRFPMGASRISREAVLDAARMLFSHSSDPTMAQVAAEAGISEASLYKLFGNRAGLMEELGLSPPLKPAERIVAAAAELVADHGLRGLSVEGAAARAGLSRGAVYRLFPGGKDALFSEVVRNVLPISEGLAFLRAMSEHPPEEVLPLLAAGMANLDPIQVEIYRAGAFDRSADTPGAADMFVELTLALADYLAAQMSAGRLRTMDPLLAVFSLSSPVIAYLVSRDLFGDLLGQQPVGEALQELVGSWLRSMRPSPDMTV